MSQKRCGPGARLPGEGTEAGNVIPLRIRNVTLQTSKSNIQRLVGLLARADTEQKALLEFRRLRRAFETDPSLANEIKAVAARDAWDLAWRAANPS